MSLKNVVSLGVVMIVPAAAAAQPVDDDCALIEVSAGRRPTLTIVNANGDLELTKRKGHVTAELDGRELPVRFLRHEGDTLRIVDDRGRTLYMVVLWGHPGPDGQIIYVPDLDPESAHSRLGLRTEPLDEDAARLLGREPGRALQVTGLCDGRPGEAAGLRENDVILGIDGRQDVTRESLNRAVALLHEGGRLELQVLRGGRRLSISLGAAPAGEWPAASRLEEYVRGALHP